ncbi:putative uridine nucleosidase [Arachis hypogaea]|nr:putative uridine nucleosidase [Arachis hypogaea]
MANSLLHEPQKLIIDTDPGIDDSIAIMMAFESSELKIIGMTTIFAPALSNQHLLHLISMLTSSRDLKLFPSLVSGLALKVFVVLRVTSRHHLALSHARMPSLSSLSPAAEEPSLRTSRHRRSMAPHRLALSRVPSRARRCRRQK